MIKLNPIALDNSPSGVLNHVEITKNNAQACPATPDPTPISDLSYKINRTIKISMCTYNDDKNVSLSILFEFFPLIEEKKRDRRNALMILCGQYKSVFQKTVDISFKSTTVAD